jgi:hypothetical protein
MKQTAVEWLHYVSKQRELDKFDWEQAKEMEKEQIMDAAKIMLEGKVILFNSKEIGDRRAEQYYNKQFKQQ